MQIDLIWLGSANAQPDWPLGKVWPTESTVRSVYDRVRLGLASSTAEAWLFWDAGLGEPDPERVRDAFSRPGDLWHAGLRLGTAGQPRLIDFANPTWMLICDPDGAIEATSWRLSLRACLVRTDVLRQMGGVQPGFLSLEAAALEMGYRYLTGGVLTRHIPWLVPDGTAPQPPSLPAADELRFISYCVPRWRGRWAIFRALFAKRLGRFDRSLIWAPHCTPSSPPVFHRPLGQPRSRRDSSVSVVLPTLGRYGYLRQCLRSLASQTIKPLEIICVDQSASSSWRDNCYGEFSQLPLRIIRQESVGQCLARNTALAEARGEWLFFADDDSEYPNDTIENHLLVALRLAADASTGLSVPPRKYEIPKAYRHLRLAYDLDTGNSLVRKRAVSAVGGFDRHYDFGKGADIDLGIRLYRSGYLLVHNPLTCRVHYKAAQGGLRQYGVWWDTKGMKITQPRPVSTRTYFVRRHFDERLWTEALIHDLVFAGRPRGNAISRLRVPIYYLGELIRLPLTCRQARKSLFEARQMLDAGPRLSDSLS